MVILFYHNMSVFTFTHTLLIHIYHLYIHYTNSCLIFLPFLLRYTLTSLGVLQCAGLGLLSSVFRSWRLSSQAQYRQMSLLVLLTFPSPLFYYLGRNTRRNITSLAKMWGACPVKLLLPARSYYMLGECSDNLFVCIPYRLHFPSLRETLPFYYVYFYCGLSYWLPVWTASWGPSLS